MTNLKKLLALVLALVVVATMFAACGGGNTEQPSNNEGEAVSNESGNEDVQTGMDAPSDWDGEPVYGGHMNLHIYTKPDTLDPTKCSPIWTLPWATCVWEAPLTRDADHNIAPGVCNFELSEDMLTLKLWVRDGVKFNNGEDVDIYDVEASISRHCGGFSPISSKYVGKYIETMVVDDATQVLTIKFKSYNEKTMYCMASYKPWIGIWPKELCEKYAGDLLIDQVEDCIGTGPYKVVEFENNIQVTIARNEYYVPNEPGYTGFAAPKMAYLDSISFWYNGDNSSATLALLNGDYDMTDVVDAEYMEMAEAQGIVRTVNPSIMGCGIVFNTRNAGVPCGNYPALRKAIMAAIDYEEFLSVVCDDSQILGGDLTLLDEYKNSVWEEQDWYGPADQDVVDKYLEEAYAQGYNDEPITILYSTTRDDIPTLLAGYMDDAGINCNVVQQEVSVYTATFGDPGNEWDLSYGWFNYAYNPGSLADNLLVTYWKDNGRLALTRQMEQAYLGTDEYKQAWRDLENLMVEECAYGHMGMIDWLWYHPATLHADFEGTFPYIYNCFWEDPENHPSKYAS